MSAFRERLGQLIYEAVYASQGGRWEAVEPREVWYAKADWLMAQEPMVTAAPEMLEALRVFAVEAQFFDADVPDLKTVHGYSFQVRDFKRAFDAVAKAEGRS